MSIEIESGTTITTNTYEGLLQACKVYGGPCTRPLIESFIYNGPRLGEAQVRCLPNGVGEFLVIEDPQLAEVEEVGPWGPAIVPEYHHTCPACAEVSDWADDRPWKFCQFCGGPLDIVVTMSPRLPWEREDGTRDEKIFRAELARFERRAT